MYLGQLGKHSGARNGWREGGKNSILVVGIAARDAFSPYYLPGREVERQREVLQKQLWPRYYILIYVRCVGGEGAAATGMGIKKRRVGVFEGGVGGHHPVPGENQSAARRSRALKVILKRDAAWTSQSFKMVVFWRNAASNFLGNIVNTHTHTRQN